MVIMMNHSPLIEGQPGFFTAPKTVPLDSISPTRFQFCGRDEEMGVICHVEHAVITQRIESRICICVSFYQN